MSANPVAVAEINNMTYASVVQSIIPANYWTPMGSFGGEVRHLPEKENKDTTRKKLTNAALEV